MFLGGFVVLIFFVDFGMLVVVMNVVGEFDDLVNDFCVVRFLIMVLCVLVVSALVILLINVLIIWIGWWPSLFGDGLLF